MAPFWASAAPKFDFDADPDPAFHSDLVSKIDAVPCRSTSATLKGGGSVLYCTVYGICDTEGKLYSIHSPVGVLKIQAQEQRRHVLFLPSILFGSLQRRPFKGFFSSCNLWSKYPRRREYHSCRLKRSVPDCMFLGILGSGSMTTGTGVDPVRPSTSKKIKIKTLISAI
jgi:hypothetical protein